MVTATRRIRFRAKIEAPMVIEKLLQGAPHHMFQH